MVAEHGVLEVQPAAWEAAVTAQQHMSRSTILRRRRYRVPAHWHTWNLTASSHLSIPTVAQR